MPRRLPACLSPLPSRIGRVFVERILAVLRPSRAEAKRSQASRQRIVGGLGAAGAAVVAGVWGSTAFSLADVLGFLIVRRRSGRRESHRTADPWERFSYPPRARPQRLKTPRPAPY